MAYRVIEATTPETLRAALDIRRIVFVEGQGVSDQLERDEKDVLETSTRHFLAFKNNAPIGACRVIFPFDDKLKAKVQRVAVLESERGCGAGKYLMECVHRLLPHVREFVLGSQAHAVPFYERIGYAVFGEPYVEADIPHRMMTFKSPAP